MMLRKQFYQLVVLNLVVLKLKLINSMMIKVFTQESMPRVDPLMLINKTQPQALDHCHLRKKRKMKNQHQNQSKLQLHLLIQQVHYKKFFKDSLEELPRWKVKLSLRWPKIAKFLTRI
jgi:hypothetical protein